MSRLQTGEYPSVREKLPKTQIRDASVADVGLAFEIAGAWSVPRRHVGTTAAFGDLSITRRQRHQRTVAMLLAAHAARSAIPSWLQRAEQLACASDEVKASRLVMCRLDRWLKAGQLSQVDDLMRDAPVAELRPIIWVTLLRYTLVARDRLPNWSHLLERSRRRLVELGLDAGLILRGLS